MPPISRAIGEHPAGCSKSLSSKAAGELKPEAYPLGYVEDFDELRTPLADFFSILLNRRCSFIVIIGRDAEGFRLALGDFLVHFIEPAARAAKDLPD